jgi:tRNA threonylcarbamoyladenosine modification (KEOPS) complex Cgi121 subunit
MQAYIIRKQDMTEKLEKNEENILVFNPEYIISKQQALFAAKMAIKAMENGQNIANKLPIEFLVRLSGRKQIAKALEFGPAGIGDTAGIISLQDTTLDNIQEISFMPDEEKIREAYNVPPSQDLARSVYEKMALVDL